MATPSDNWGADVAVSMPSPTRTDHIVKHLGDGWALTQWGLVPDLTMNDLEEYVVPTWSPPLGVMTDA